MKDTRLDDSASIYQKRADHTERQKFRQLSGKQKFQYFKDYYLVKLLAAIAIFAFLISLGITIFSPKEEIILNMAFFNATMDEDTIAAIKNDLFSLLKPKKEQNVVVDASFYYNPEQTDQATVATEQKFSTYLFTERIDLVIAERDIFQIYMERGIFTDLADTLPTNLYSRLASDVVLGTAGEAEEETPYGISLKNYQPLKDYTGCYEDPIVGIIANAPNKHNSVKAIKLLTKD